MIFFPAVNLEGAVNLFDEQQPYHLMRKGHLRKAQPVICCLAYLLGQAKGTANQKGDITAAGKPQLVDGCRQFLLGFLLAEHIQNKEVTALRHQLQEFFPFFG